MIASTISNAALRVGRGSQASAGLIRPARAPRLARPPGRARGVLGTAQRCRQPIDDLGDDRTGPVRWAAVSRQRQAMSKHRLRKRFHVVG
jgi:hypothetical protein